MNEATLQYVRQHADDDVRQLALTGSKNPEVDLQAALQQIAGRQTALRKLPTWAACEGILYPPHLNMEQCSSEQTARYKAAVVASLERSAPTTLIDLTGGFGVDFSFIAPLFDKAVYVERQQHLCQLAVHNFAALGVKAEVVCADSVDYLHSLTKATMIFLDPARRDEHGARTYGISDCTPNVLALRDELMEKADYVVLKLSPMLDWRKAVKDLGEPLVRQVHIVSVDGECKELLIVLSKEGEGLHLICANDDERFEVDACITSQTIPSSQTSLSSITSPTSLASLTSLSGSLCFLYEPNASIMKGGCFAELAARFGVSALAQNSHLFVSDRLITNFPGRKFRIEAVSSMNKKELKEKVLPLKQANITVRNFPLTVAELRKRLKLSEGGSHYIFATTLANSERVLLLCEKINHTPENPSFETKTNN